MPTRRISASALLTAPAARVYAIIADYAGGHARILPRPPFVSLTVEQGGVGAGTVVNFQMKVAGQTRSFHSTITEPEPGRVLVETDAQAGTVTTFTVEPRNGGQAAFVTIATDTPVRAGLMGKLEGWLAERMLKPTYEQELKLLESVALEGTG
jgi:uncharacterized protein YndB with AHSA1/START domain